MAQIQLKGSPINTSGTLPPIGSQAPDFKLTTAELTGKSLKDFAGQKVVLNIFPSIDTGICATAIRKFNQEASSLVGTVVVGISKDSPFALRRFCGAEGIDKVITTSLIRDDAFGTAYGVRIMDGGMEGMMSRAVVILNETGKVIYTEQVPEIGQEPNYEAAFKALK